MSERARGPIKRSRVPVFTSFYRRNTYAASDGDDVTTRERERESDARDISYYIRDITFRSLHAKTARVNNESRRNYKREYPARTRAPLRILSRNLRGKDGLIRAFGIDVAVAGKWNR